MTGSDGPRHATPAGQDDALLAAMVRSAHDAVFATDLHRTVLAWNDSARTLYGYPAEDIVGRPADVLFPPERHSDLAEVLLVLRMGGRVDRFRAQHLHRGGGELEVSVAVSPLRGPGGVVAGSVWLVRPISERERHEASFQALLEAAPDAIIGVDPADRVVLANTQAERLFKLARHGLIGRDLRSLFAGGPPDGSHPPEVAGDPRPEPATPASALLAGGTALPVEISTSILDTQHGRVRCLVIRDVTERLRAQAEQLTLRAEAERNRVEAHLQRTQRLESLGQLAGGIAHDFNNLVAIILNYASFIAEEATEAELPTIARDAGQIIRAGQRGAELTHQLLAFARREVTRPRVLNLNEVVAEVEDMLRRSIGEHITLKTHLTEDLPNVLADPAQMEQVLVNLAVNARDAMRDGGRLAIETAERDVDTEYAAIRPALKPGRYVRLRISDTGTGMPRDVIERAFEPFFTTKPSGQGTGLGLATVYGIITQADGDLTIYSEVGMGTTISILLPATDQPAASDDVDHDPAGDHGRGETVLLVEDETALREAVQRILVSAGYRVLSAADGPDALEIARAHTDPVDLLLTDVVMPTVLGRELARQVVAVHPETRTLFMSGYAQPVLAAQGTLDPGVALLEKPFTKHQLLSALRRQLTRQEQTA